MAHLITSQSILKDPLNIYSFSQLNSAETFSEDIDIEEGERVIFPFQTIDGLVNLHKINGFQAKHLTTINGGLVIDSCGSITLPELKSVSYLKLRNISSITLPSLEDCPVIFLENVNQIVLPVLTESVISAVNVLTLQTVATGTLYTKEDYIYDCPNLTVDSVTDVMPVGDYLYTIKQVKELSPDLIVYYLSGSDQDNDLIHLAHSSGICVYADTLEEAQTLLEQKLKK